MERHEIIESWLFQQRDAFRSFLKQLCGSPDSNHISTLLRGNPAVKYGGHSDPLYKYIRKNDYKSTFVVMLQFSFEGHEREIPIPFPREDGIFEINGEEYFFPIQRIICDKDATPPLVEYRRIDHVIIDTWERQKLQKHEFRTRSEEFSRQGSEPLKVLYNYLSSLFIPDGSANIRRLEGNRWAALVEQSQVSTFGVEKAEDDHSDTPVVAPKYKRIYSSDKYGIKVRVPLPGLDPFHTPETEKIGLKRYLGVGTWVGDDRQLHQKTSEQNSIGVLSRCIPFLQHNDPRRILMGCKMMAQAQPVEEPEEPKIITEFERQICSTFPKLTENLGVNLRTGFMFWKGLNYEDAVVVSQSAARKLRIVERKKVSVPVPAYVELVDITNNQFNMGVRRIGQEVDKGDSLLQLCYRPNFLSLNIFEKLPETLQKEVVPFASSVPWKDPSLLCKAHGRIVDLSKESLWDKDAPCASFFSMRFDFVLEIERPLEVGDKLCNRHGNKGVVSSILPDSEMPKVHGQHLEVLFNPIGVLNRGNYGQIFEALAGPLNKSVVNIPFGLTESLQDRIDAVLQGEGLTFDSVEVPDSRKRTINAVTGTNYILRLPHHASDQFKVHGYGKYSSITGQPARGLAQKYGEMEFWALQAHGARWVLAALCRRIRKRGHGYSPPQEALRDWLLSIGLQFNIEAEKVSLESAGCSTRPNQGHNLFDEELKSVKDPESIWDGEGKVIKQNTVLRRLSSEAFFQEFGPIYIDLGKEIKVSVNLYNNPKHKYEFTGRYLTILPPGYRKSPTGRHKTKLTKSYGELVKALWRAREEESKGVCSSAEAVEHQLEELLKKLLQKLDGKDGIIHEVGLCRRLNYSARMVIVPDPQIAVDEVAIPWDAARILFKDSLEGPSLDEEVLSTPQSQMSTLVQQFVANHATKLLQNRRLLLNRTPSLHKYSILAFRPVVHFDGKVLKIPPFVTSPYNADADGDAMTVVPIFDPFTLQEAEDLLSPRANLISDADGSLLIGPNKDYRLGLWSVRNNKDLKSRLNQDLSAAGLPFKISAQGDPVEDIHKAIATRKMTPDQSLQCLDILTKHAISGLGKVLNQSAFGDKKRMEAFYEALIASGAAKKDRLYEDTPLIEGVKLPDLLGSAEKPITNMIKGKESIGKFGAYLKNLCYRFVSCNSSGLAFEGQLREALVAAQSITECATQRALSPKSGNEPLKYQEFDKCFINCLKYQGNIQKLQDFDNLSNLLDLDSDYLYKHLTSIRNVWQPKLQKTGILFVLSRQYRGLCQPLPITGDGRDPRIALFLT